MSVDFNKNKKFIVIDCFCGHNFLFCEENIPENQIYEAECPACHAFIKRRKVSKSKPEEKPSANNNPTIKTPEIETTKCPVCGKMNLRIGDFGIQDIREEFRVVCDSCDFCSETQSSDYGEVFWAFLDDEYKKIIAEHNKKVYNKLVRDKIPDIIEANGEICQIRILNDDVDYLKALQRKLDEEVAEYHKDDTIEELADIVEVVYALVKAHGISKEHFEKVVADKRNKKGGFDNRIMLKETYNANPDN